MDLLFAILPIFMAVAGPGGAAAPALPPAPDFPTVHPAFADVPRPFIVGHGGAKHLCAPNTLPCFQRALDLGAVALEADLQVLADGTLVVYHDVTAELQAGDPRVIARMTAAEVRELDAGWGFTRDGGQTWPLRGKGVGVPTLDEFLEAFPKVPILLDAKPESPAMADALLAFARDRLTERDRRRLYIKSNDAVLPGRLRALAPPPRVAMSEVERLLLLLDPAKVRHLPPTWIDLRPARIDPEIVAWARAHGHILTASTVNRVRAMRRLRDGPPLDGIVTDRPDLLRRVLAGAL